MSLKIIIPFILLLQSFDIDSLVENISGYDKQRLFEMANNHYSETRYEEAIIFYEQILKSGYTSADVYFNLGNAYFRTHKIPYAILNYERALLLAPNDDDIKFNLELARSFTIDKIDALPEFFLISWKKWFERLLTTDQWAILSLVSFILALSLILFYLFSRKLMLRKVAFGFSAGLILVAIISFTTSYTNKKYLHHHNGAIIINPSVTVKSSPDERGTELFVIHEGSKVFIDSQIGNWYKIRLIDGNTGWVQDWMLEKI